MLLFCLPGSANIFTANAVEIVETPHCVEKKPSFQSLDRAKQQCGAVFLCKDCSYTCPFIQGHIVSEKQQRVGTCCWPTVGHQLSYRTALLSCLSSPPTPKDF